MRRHAALQDLSRDHHVVLYHWQQVRRALARHEPWAELQERVEALLAFYESDMKAHFQEEDDLVVPAARATSDATLQAVAVSVLDEHGEFRTRLAELASSRDSESTTRALLAHLEPRITEHVRREEAELFEGVQAVLSEEELQALWRRLYEFRRAHRSPAACSSRPPRTPR